MNKIIKHISITTATILTLSLLFVRCGDFLEMPLVSSAVNQDTIFSSRAKAEMFLWDTYQQIMPFGLPLYKSTNNDNYDQIDRCIRANLTDECNQSIGACPATEMNNVGYTAAGSQTTPSRYSETKMIKCYSGIRKAWTFIENVDRVPDIPQEEKERMKAECKTLIALRYFTLVRTFGGVPLVKRVLSPEDDLMIGRSSFDECVNYIVSLCEEAELILPDQYPTQWRGRVTKGAALSVKARTLLYAASPLFNTQNPVLNYGNPEHNKYLCYMNYDVTRWEKAYKANLAVIDWATSKGGISLINTGNPFDDYGTATSVPDNTEIILANKTSTLGHSNTGGFTTYYLPNLGAFNKGSSIMVNALYQFYKADGTEQSWPAVGEEKPFSEYTEKMAQMEPRFKAIGWIYGEKPAMCPDRYAGWNYVITGANSGDIQGCAVMMKFTYKFSGSNDQPFPIFRLSEFYLNCAEAINEYSANNPIAYEMLNQIRRRAGLPAISSSDSRYNTQNKLGELIKRERFIELFGEDHRIYDVRRWRIADTPGIIGGNMLGFVLKQNTTKTDYLTYTTKNFENRYWNDKMFYHPFPQLEVNKGYLVQNPGY
ncbi:RagB/SusD family nutrient uptake outer membrane protein [uncultured Dysgonomonas sp.]|uniref:RagB/SusD family nutrient uptake outer membrane protein n=1 Tax=uncultured Dysgonomonas sp. TaxID=206096 RepID=A0A212JCQ6_9BACT|nr:RagB/SusD family nutrient uptake outer membrane protein [uncultured Dysgonomonas sp.]SBV97226.1 conserved exported hypothetical protein [uncultured Dysgonomonas sp.]